GELLHVLADELLVGQEDAGASPDRRLAPGGECRLGRGDGLGHLVGGAHRHPRDLLLGGRVDQVAPAAGLRLAKFTVDQHRYAGQRGIGHGSLLIGMGCGLDRAGIFARNLYTTFTSRSKPRKWKRKAAYAFANRRAICGTCEMTTARKLFVGPRVRRLRERRGWTQGALAGRLALSLSYVSQIENNQRPVTAAVLLKLADVFGGDIAQFSDEGDRHRLAELDAALNDRTLHVESVPPVALARMVEQAPELAEAFLNLYQRHQRLQEDHAQMVDRLYGEFEGGRARGRLVRLPHEEVREHLNRRDNYLDSLDRLGEDFATRRALRPGARASVLVEALKSDCGIEAVVGQPDFAWLRRFEPARRRLTIAPQLSDAQQAFQ